MLKGQELINWWGEASSDEKDALVLVRIFGWRWECWPNYLGVSMACLVPPKGDDWEPTNYPHRVAVPCGPHVQRYSDWAANPWNKKTNQMGIPRPTSPDSPRRLVEEVEQKTIERFGFALWWDTYFELSRNWTKPGYSRHMADLVRATADQRLLVCAVVASKCGDQP